MIWALITCAGLVIWGYTLPEAIKYFAYIILIENSMLAIASTGSILYFLCKKEFKKTKLPLYILGILGSLILLSSYSGLDWFSITWDKFALGLIIIFISGVRDAFYRIR